MSDCQIWLACSASNFLCAGGSEQLACGEAALFEEAMEAGGGEGGFVLTGHESQLAPQGGAGAMRIFTFEAFDQIGQLGRDGARLPAILTRLGGQGFKAPPAIVERPVQPRVD